MIFSLLLLSLSLLPGICLSLWSIGGEVKVELVPLLYCIFTMQVMILIYNILLLFMNVAIYFSLSFYTQHGRVGVDDALPGGDVQAMALDVLHCVEVVA